MCPRDYSQYGTAEKCIKIITTLMNSTEGQALCEEDGGNLASVLNQNEADYIKDNLPMHVICNSFGSN